MCRIWESLSFFAFVGVVMLLGGCSQENSSKTSTVTIGVLSNTTLLEPVLNGFKDRMNELGYVEGENVTFLYDGSHADTAQLEVSAQALIDSDVNLILALGLPAAQVAQHTTTQTGTPVVFVPVEDPVKAGLVETLSQPGGNLTGISYGENNAKRLDWLTRVIPTVTRVYVPYDPETGSLTAAWEAINHAAETLNIEIIACACQGAADPGQALRTLPPDVDAVFLLADPTLARYLPFILAAARQSHLPIAAPTSELLAVGALFAYGMDMPAAGKQAAKLAANILKGSRPGELPVEIADSVLTINLKAADELGLEIRYSGRPMC